MVDIVYITDKLYGMAHGLWDKFGGYLDSHTITIALVTIVIFITYLYISFSNHQRYKKYKKLTLHRLRNMSWQELEELSGILLERMGYIVRQEGGAHADGGIDVVAYKLFDRRPILVQCKQYKKSKIGIKIVRECYGVLMHEKAHEMWIVTCGEFTRECEPFVKDKPLRLIDGEKLVRLVNKYL